MPRIRLVGDVHGSAAVLVLADHACFVLHTALVMFNVVGWAWARTRPWHLVTMGATAFSWFVLGAWYGWGYCLCTDGHLRIRRALGKVDPEDSYVQLLATHWFGLTIDLSTANVIAASVFAFILLATAATWIRVARSQREHREAG